MIEIVLFLRYTQFVQGQNLKDSQCIVFAHHRPSAADLTRTQLRKFAFVCRLSMMVLRISIIYLELWFNKY